MVDSIPSFKIEAQASVDIKEEDKEFVEGIHIKYHGDGDIDPPTTYEVNQDFRKWRKANLFMIFFLLIHTGSHSSG